MTTLNYQKTFLALVGFTIYFAILYTDPANIVQLHPISNDSVELGSTEDVPEDSSLMPIRGPGDTQLPFLDKIYTQVTDPPNDIFNEEPLKGNETTNLKKILFWNAMVVEYGRDKHYKLGYGQEPFIRGKCRVNTCYTTRDRQKFRPEEIDAVIWNFRADDRSLPKVRWPHTRYVYYNIETPAYLFGNIRVFNDMFNWTLTYLKDSDFHYPYDIIYRRRSPLPEKHHGNKTSGKTKLAAWFVTNCHASSRREFFVRQMQRYMNVDIYGSCGPLKCNCPGPKMECALKQPEYCYKMLEKDYKFYLSFENSLCKDYVTEKFFNILRYDVVPVVYGLANYSSFAPPNSYINALDFPSAQELADFLQKLSKDEAAYNEYFRWKRYHHFASPWVMRMAPWCDLCERLHTDKTHKTYELTKWFVEESHCRSSFDTARQFHLQVHRSSNKTMTNI